MGLLFSRLDSVNPALDKEEETRFSGRVRKVLSGRQGLFVSGVCSCILYLWLARFDALNGPLVFVFLAIVAALFCLYLMGYRSTRSNEQAGLLVPVILLGLLFRIILLPAGLRQDRPLMDSLWKDLTGQQVTYEPFLLYDQDVWRYLWEGRVASFGFNPYLHPPSDPQLDQVVTRSDSPEIWREIRDRVTFPGLPSLYPPLSILTFRLSHATFPGSVLGWKLWLVLFECGAGVALGLALRRLQLATAPGLLLYAWNPLAIKAFAGSAHFDALVVLALSLVVLAISSKKAVLSQVSVGLAVLAKFVPGILLPLVGMTTAGLLMTGTGILLAWYPYFTPEIFDTGHRFASEWRFNAGFFAVVEKMLGEGPAMAIYALLVLCVVAFFWRRKVRDPVERIRTLLWTLGPAILLGPVVNPWYVTWLLPFAVIIRSRVWLCFSGIVFFAFFVMYDMVERSWLVALEYILLLAVVLWETLSREERTHVV